EVAGGQGTGPGGSHQADDEQAVVRQQGLLDYRGAAGKTVQPLQALRQPAQAACASARQAAQFGGDTQRADAQIGQRRQGADQYAADPRRPARAEQQRPQAAYLAAGTRLAITQQPGRQRGEHGQLQQQRAAIAEPAGQPEHRRLLQGREVQRVPAGKAQGKAEQGAGQGRQ